MNSAAVERKRRLSEADGADHRSSGTAISPRELNRARIIAAMTSAVGEEGIANASVTRVLARARIARAAFYQAFHDRDDCLRVAVESAVERSRAHVLGAYRAQSPWRAQVRAGLQALLVHFESEPDSARLCISYARQPNATSERLRRRILDELAAAIDRGRDGEHKPPAAITAEGIVAGTLGVLETRLADAQRPPLTDLVAPLMSFIVLPYRGARAAREELSLASPPPPRAMNNSEAHTAVKRMRITHRRMLVLAAIGENPGLSNAEVAKRAQIADQGQISKLLKRLCALGLIENVAGRAHGQPNAWYLTRAGRNQSAILEHRARRG